MKKKLRLLTAALLIAAMTVPTAVFADTDISTEETQEDVELFGTNITVVWRENPDSLLTISGSGSIAAADLADYKHARNSNMKVIIKEGITGTGSAFAAADGWQCITSISLPNSLTSIGASSFKGIHKLSGNFTIPEKVTKIGKNAFGTYNTGITEYHFKGTTPPTLGENALCCSSSCKIYVPVGCGDAYKSAEGWSLYADKIEEGSGTSGEGSTIIVGDVTSDRKVDVKDYASMLKKIAFKEYKLPIESVYTDYVKVADADGNGTFNLLDVINLVKR